MVERAGMQRVQAKILNLQTFFGKRFAAERQCAAFKGMYADLQTFVVLTIVRIGNRCRAFMQLRAIDAQQSS